ncbi:MAG: hypothetical protein A3K83_06115 [Omnitrophica WOR_2 bacterium RBG_13_44_8b]|nr:MAG: hypothetical protein A3K83_06115 [Omnitrophica WOR_2 bacterium RBG_13_44_8b]
MRAAFYFLKEQAVEKLRKTGIGVVGDVHWGTHFCQFYQTKQDLIDILVPYFKAGLKNNEFCMWVTSEPLGVEEAKKAMAKAVPDLKKYLRKGQIEIIPHTDWYLKGGSFNSRRVLNSWVNKLNRAQAKGYAGLRLTGNTFWLEKKNWGEFTDYEEEINSVIGEYKMIAVCTYSLDKCGSLEVIDVVRNHQFALIKRAGKWEIIQSLERKKAEKEIIHLASFPELNPRPICEVDLKGNISYMNPGIKRLFPEIARAGIRHPWFTDFKTKIMPEFRDRAKKTVTRELAVGKYYFEQAITYIPERECIRIYGQDITERMKAEEALRETSDYLESLFNYANAPIICWDVKFKITRFNHAFEHLTNYQAKEVIGKDLSMLFPKDSSKESLNKIKRALKGEHWDVVEIPILRKDGGIRTVLWNSANVYAEGGKTLLATIAQGQDITARKKITEALKKANVELELKIAQRTEELMRVQNELNDKKRLSDIGTLAATVAHELRNPLAAIKMATYNIKRKAQNPLLDKHLSNIETKVSESEQIINNLLFYSRIKMPQYGKVNIYDTLNESISSAIERYQKQEVSLVKRMDPLKGILCEADGFQIKEVFSNVLNNAFDATWSRKGHIEVGGDIKNDSVRIYIRDNGAGIEDYNLNQVFEPFFTTKAKGTGLGLSVCNQIVRLHQGTINIESQQDKGTTVTIELPLRPKINA